MKGVIDTNSIIYSMKLDMFDKLYSSEKCELIIIEKIFKEVMDREKQTFKELEDKKELFSSVETLDEDRKKIYIKNQYDFIKKLRSRLTNPDISGSQITKLISDAKKYEFNLSPNDCELIYTALHHKLDFLISNDISILLYAYQIKYSINRESLIDYLLAEFIMCQSDFDEETKIILIRDILNYFMKDIYEHIDKETRHYFRIKKRLFELKKFCDKSPEFKFIGISS